MDCAPPEHLVDQQWIGVVSAKPGANPLRRRLHRAAFTPQTPTEAKEPFTTSLRRSGEQKA